MIQNPRKEMIERIKKVADEESVDEIINIIKEYEVDTHPENSCHECWNFHQIQPHEVTHVGNFYDPGRCSLGYVIYKHRADICPNFHKRRVFRKSLGGDLYATTIKW